MRYGIHQVKENKNATRTRSGTPTLAHDSALSAGQPEVFGILPINLPRRVI